MRLFVALEIAVATREELRALVARLRPKCPAAKWVRPEGMHVTLKFLGETAPEQAAKIRAALAGLRTAEAVEMRFRGLGFFPNEKRPRVFWCGVEASANAVALAAEIDRAMTALGAEPEARPFAPHLTLARINSHDLHERGKQPEGLAEIVAEARANSEKEFGSMRAEEFHLFESRLKPSGAEYARVASFRFTGAAPAP